MSNQLPASWVFGPLGDLLPINYGKALRSDARAQDGKFAVFGSNGVVGQHDVALTSGPAIVVGRKGGAGLVHFSSEPCWVIDTAYYTESNDALELKLSSYWLRALRLEAWDRSTAIPSLSRDDYNALDVPVPPKNEQRRIVAKIEELFSDLDASVAALERARANLKRYRASVLKAAVEGRLTEAWHKAHPAAEPADKLLERILVERRKKWEAAQLKKFADAGKAPPKDWKDKYPEPAQPDTANLPELPEGWCWATVDQVSQIQRYGSSAKTSEEINGVPVLRMGNIQDGNLDLEKLKYLPDDHHEFPDLLLEKGDLLFNRTNSAELVGKTAVYKGLPERCSFASYLIGVRLVEGCAPDYVSNFINSLHGRRWVGSVVSQQVGQANVNGTKLAALTFPLPPENEQRAIVLLVEEKLSIAEKTIFELERNQERASRLRQSILKRAFEGKLVPQDPNDEPAPILLARIRAARAKDAEASSRVTPKRRGRKRKT